MTLPKIVELVTKKEIPASQRYLIFEVSTGYGTVKVGEVATRCYRFFTAYFSTTRAAPLPKRWFWKNISCRGLS